MNFGDSEEALDESFLGNFFDRSNNRPIFSGLDNLGYVKDF